MRPHDLPDLARLSARIGREPEQVQAAGGNTSLKDNGVLWVKASGLWLADAEARDLFVPVDLGSVQAGIARGAADPVKPAVITDRNPENLRPSIETTLHALLPHRVVVHTHSVRTLAQAVCADAKTALAERLDGLAWAFVPYRQPGLPLTRAVAEWLRQGPTDVLVLGNHGLVVGGDSVVDAERLLAEVERRLDVPVRPTPVPDTTCLKGLAEALGLRLPVHERTHALAADAARAAEGSLYPDHVIFLGPAATVLPDEPEAARPVLAEAEARGSKLFLVEGVGALLAVDAGPSADEMALCLALVLERLPPDAPLHRLTRDDEAALMDWDAEKYRQALAKREAPGT